MPKSLLILLCLTSPAFSQVPRFDNLKQPEPASVFTMPDYAPQRDKSMMHGNSSQTWSGDYGVKMADQDILNYNRQRATQAEILVEVD